MRNARIDIKHFPFRYSLKKKALSNREVLVETDKQKKRRLQKMLPAKKKIKGIDHKQLHFKK
jgi:hypothetical protein